MSRVGKQPVEIPNGVEVLAGVGEVTVKGPRGALSCPVTKDITVHTEDGKVLVKPLGGTKQTSANYGTMRASINNMVLGVTQGWKRALEINGVGYSAEVDGAILVLRLGHSHDVRIPLPEGVQCKVNRSLIELESNDKQVVGELAAKIRAARPPEPYLGKGVKYAEETIKRKAGKSGA